jgi:hypothetical protein
VATISGFLLVGEQAANAASQCKDISGPGKLCVVATADGSDTDIEAKFTYTGTSNITGHVVLGNFIGTGCHPGDFDAQSPVETLYNSDSAIASKVVDISSIWTATWWSGGVRIATECFAY